MYLDCHVQGLTLDIDRGNLLRLGKDGIILAASHGTRKMSDIEIEKSYGRGRRKHIATNYATHLNVSLIILSCITPTSMGVLSSYYPAN